MKNLRTPFPSALAGPDKPKKKRTGKEKTRDTKKKREEVETCGVVENF